MLFEFAQQFPMSTEEWITTCCKAGDSLRVIVSMEGITGLFNERSQVLFIIHCPGDEIQKLIAASEDHPRGDD